MTNPNNNIDLIQIETEAYINAFKKTLEEFYKSRLEKQEKRLEELESKEFREKYFQEKCCKQQTEIEELKKELKKKELFIKELEAEIEEVKIGREANLDAIKLQEN